MTMLGNVQFVANILIFSNKEGFFYLILATYVLTSSTIYTILKVNMEFIKVYSNAH